MNTQVVLVPVDSPASGAPSPSPRGTRRWLLDLRPVTDDRSILIAAQRFMCERAGSKAMEVPGNHAIYVSNPRAVATIIEAAASAELAAR